MVRIIEIMKEKLTWDNLKPNRLVDIWLYSNNKALEKVYILEAYTISPEVDKLRRHRGQNYFGILIKSYGMRKATTLNNSYEFIYSGEDLGRSGTYEDIFSSIEKRISVLVSKKCKKGYKDVSADVSFHIPALHKNREGIISSAISESFLMKDVAQQNLKNRDVGKFVNIL